MWIVSGVVFLHFCCACLCKYRAINLVTLSYEKVWSRQWFNCKPLNVMMLCPNYIINSSMLYALTVSFWNPINIFSCSWRSLTIGLFSQSVYSPNRELSNTEVRMQFGFRVVLITDFCVIIHCIFLTDVLWNVSIITPPRTF